MFTRWSEHHGDVNGVIYDTDGACKGQYGCNGGPTRANMGSRECFVMGLKSCAASAWVTISVKHVIKMNSES